MKRPEKKSRSIGRLARRVNSHRKHRNQDALAKAKQATGAKYRVLASGSLPALLK